MKKISLMLALIFLLIELLYFSSNNAVLTLKDSKIKNNIYEVAVEEKKEEFLEDYKEIILEEKENSLILLTTNQKMQEIKEKYPIVIENN